MNFKTLLCLLIVLPLAALAEDDYLSGEFDLVEYKINSAPGVAGGIHCTEPEILEGLWDMIYFGGGEEPGRRLNASRHPLHRDAAWYIDQDDCQSQKPYYNGIGFDSIDKKTGEAVIYIAAFNKVNLDEDKYARADGIGRMAMFFQPDFEVININTYNAQCDFEKRGLPVIGKLDILGNSKTLNCVLENEQGYLKLRQR